ncbi:uncharacterized protein Z518_03989 [Rhinocladiella mackenziei CBS 650.93]|uniref:WW domain-containing protein n=1 Tax=Rhinocladiella mackenziei CBS 650.93 TaxID=1442369 RepID=A0A0D2JA87_9EURO|nr:uncharacterized protein Z518_03989 [Rhinocladiella mackenziei CBS 650.93]KIX06015.1 hypothetical protein Z518_03989 [Rhinocladiella mackenziei CBS 650.93]
MLKSTYRPPVPTPTKSPLPPEWTEHKAPSGRTYYYNAETKQSTYTRPSVPSDEPLRIDYDATEPDHVVRASMQALEQFHRNNATSGAGGFSGARSHQDRSRRRGDRGDRPKSKAAIPNCAPWVLVKTKLGRRFVHNTETKQSLWKFPQDVMMAVIEMDKLEWEAKKKAGGETREAEEAGKSPTGDTTSPKGPQPDPGEGDYDSDSYEEVEVTDDEEGEEDGGRNSSKRLRLSQDDRTSPPSRPVEFDEDDIAYQLAQMEEDYGPDEDGLYDQNEDDEDQGLPLTASDNLALFRSLLDDSGISPYSTFEKLIEGTAVVEDPRYVALPNTSARKEAFASWSKDRIAELQELKNSEQARAKPKDPRAEYLRFLQRHATPRLYWPEFKRKFKKETVMRDLGMQDRDREKLYREFVARLKTSDAERRKELVALLKGVDKAMIKRDMPIEELPDSILRDLRFYTLEERRRDELVQTFLETL